MPATETPEHRLKRLTIRSWRRGMKEMDLILGPFADRALAALAPEDLDLYEALLAENDQDLYLWLTGARPAPGRLAGIVRRVALAAGAAPDDL
ncbi:MAG: succinate dehydrogenase assembly factor 2 [Proteobacteria bacterium]|nr:succinate dehydrogenase assembly factor 2 [Pseudomonadota bacterium]MBS0574445.1 succinate dehydrogenase assembly factor 2 [Pseudomonadota bacterium]